jgi:membrane protein DedA with SNARE-associated domain
VTITAAFATQVPRGQVQAAAGRELTGLSGVVSDVVAALGEVGVGLLTLAENVFPPIPSEVILPLAGYLANRGRLDVVWVLIAATAGSLLGALILYALGARLGEDRAKRLLARLPLVDVEDIDRAAGWFRRHGSSAVFFGRLIPGVRSLISVPAGADRMPVLRFTMLTLVGSALWNTLLVGAGYALGTQWRVVDRYAGVLDWIVIAVVVGMICLGIGRRLRQRRGDQVT